MKAREAENRSLLKRMEEMEVENQASLREARKKYEEDFFLERNKFYSEMDRKKFDIQNLVLQEKKIYQEQIDELSKELIASQNKVKELKETTRVQDSQRQELESLRNEHHQLNLQLRGKEERIKTQQSEWEAVKKESLQLRSELSQLQQINSKTQELQSELLSKLEAKNEELKQHYHFKEKCLTLQSELLQKEESIKKLLRKKEKQEQLKEEK